MSWAQMMRARQILVTVLLCASLSGLAGAAPPVAADLHLDRGVEPAPTLTRE